MRITLTKFACAVAIALLVNVGELRAGVVVSNLTDTVNGHGTIYASGPSQEYAQEFTTGSQSVQLASVVAVLGAASGDFTAAASLVEDSGGLPGSTVLTSFTVPTIGTSYSQLTFDATSSVLLSANTSYWFILSATGTTGYYRWEYTDTPSSNIGDYTYSRNNGTSWNTPGTGPFLIQVNSVPEPAALVLGGTAGVVGIGTILSRRFRARQDVMGSAH